jgi:hypothetical protein
MSMTSEEKIILDLSNNVQNFLEEQQIDLYEELQQEVPDLHVQIEADPEAPSGTRDLVQVLYGTAAVIVSLSPIIIHIINRFTPPNRTVSYKTDITETQNPDGSITTHRIHVYSEDEQRPWTLAPYANQQTSTPPKQIGQAPDTSSKNQ